VDDDAVNVWPLGHEPKNLARVIRCEEDIVWLWRRHDVVEGQPQHRSESARDLRRRGSRVTDRDANFDAARLIPLGCLTRKNSQLDAAIHADA
jgi:hypothetical protein